jgi:hypothetical protein
MMIKNVYFSVFDSHCSDGCKTLASPLFFELDGGQLFNGCFVVRDGIAFAEPEEDWDEEERHERAVVRSLEDLWIKLEREIGCGGLVLSTDNPVVFGPNESHVEVLGVKAPTYPALHMADRWSAGCKALKTIRSVLPYAWCVPVNIQV